MPVRKPLAQSPDAISISQLARGRSDVTGTITLTTGSTVTTLSNQAIQRGDTLRLTAESAAAAAELSALWITPASSPGSMVIHHTSTGSSTRTYAYEVRER